METYSKFLAGYSKLAIIAETSVLPTETQLEVFHKNISLGSFYLASVQNQPNTAFGTPLLFQETITTDGSKFIFQFTPSDINSTQEKFDSGVWHFKLTDGTTTDEVFGIVNDEAIMCCIANKLSTDCGCSSERLTEVNDTNALLLGAKANIRMNNPDAATCLYDMADFSCNECGNC